jgi:hypothetical protein
MTDSVIPITDEQAKLGQEIMKLGQETLKTLRGLGSFLDKALGSTPEALVGYLGGDWLHVRRAENMARMLYKARERLAALGMNETTPAPLSLALPILQGAADEDREELVDLWARLLASAMDPATRNNVRHEFIAAVKQMDPSDATVLQHIYSEKVTNILSQEGGDNIRHQSLSFISKRLGYRRDNIVVSIEHLEALGFLITDQIQRYDWHPGARLNEFMLACYPELEV